jgi:hypothetical protein
VARSSPKRSSSSASTASASARISRAICSYSRVAWRRVGSELRAVDGDHPDPNQPRLGAERKHLTEQLRQRSLVALPGPSDRCVIRRLVGADHPRGDILDAAPLKAPRRALADRIAVEQQRNHHRRVVRFRKSREAESCRPSGRGNREDGRSPTTLAAP